MVRNKMCNLQTRLKHKDLEKTNNMHNRAELSMNENTKRPQRETMLNPVNMSEICCII